MQCFCWWCSWCCFWLKKAEIECCCHFHIDWCQRWIWVKATTAMLFLLWSLSRLWLDFLWKYSIISQHNYGMLSYRMLSFSHETCMLSTSNKWIYFQTITSIGFEIIYENLSQVPEYFQPHILFILSNTSSSSTQLKEL